ncbi:MFS general substrate transporter [Mycena polygramma]|nr:MFS general substrate transporter [Mycena polygramma]
MGCGVLDIKEAHVPGTALFSEDPNATAYAAYEGLDIHLLQHATGKYKDIILVPQPSRIDLNDPLLWPTWKKHMFFFILIYGTVLAGAVGPLVAADQTHIAALFHASPWSIRQMLGVSTIFLQVGSVKFGKRPVSALLKLRASIDILLQIYLITSLLLCVSTVWAMLTIAVSRNDIYHVHERSIPVAIWNLALINGINITPIITGQILNKPNLGFRWAFRFFAIAVGVLCIAQFLFMPETTFSREAIVPQSSIQSPSNGYKERVDICDTKDDRPQPTKPLRGYVSSLKMWNGVYKTASTPFTLLMRPLLLFFTPIVFWGGLIYGMGITFLVIFAVTVSIIFSQPPYNFSAASVGLTYIGPLIAAFIGTLLAGPLTGYCARILSKHNKGIFEPEFKLLPVILYAIFGTMGFVGFGMSLQRGLPWIAPVMFTAIANFGIVMGSTAAISYVIDSHRHTADAALGSLIVHKNVWSFGASNETSYENSILKPSGVLAFTCILTIPMYIFGKR